MFNVPNEWYEWDSINEKWYSTKLDEIWGKGMIDVGEVNRKSAHYVAKYTIKHLFDYWDYDDIRVKPYAVMSKNPGIGNCYVNEKNRDYHTRNEVGFTTLKGGYKQDIGRYLRGKIWPEKKEQMEYSLQAEEGRIVQGKTQGIVTGKPTSLRV